VKKNQLLKYSNDDMQNEFLGDLFDKKLQIEDEVDLSLVGKQIKYWSRELRKATCCRLLANLR
jgi:hypothetical protein